MPLYGTSIARGLGIFCFLLAISLGLSHTAAQKEREAEATVDAPASKTPDEVRLAELQADLQARETQYKDAVTELTKLTRDVETKRSDHQALLDQAKAPAEIAASQQSLESYERRLELARERVDLAIAERNAVQALITQLAKKIAYDRKATEPKSPVPAAAPAPDQGDAPAPIFALPGNGAPPAADAIENTPNVPLSERVAKAEQAASEKAAKATEAREAVETIEQRRKTLEENISLERKRLANSHKRHDNLSQTLLKLEEELFRELNAGQEFASLTELAEERDEAQAQLQQISGDINEQSQRIEELQTQLMGLQQEQIVAAQEAAATVADAQAARRDQWLVTLSDYAVVALPKVAGILLLLFVGYYLLRIVGSRLIALWSQTERGSVEEQQNRAQTLVSVFENSATTALYAFGALMILDALRVPVGTLLGGVAVFGLAVAFGAQNLIRDYFYGFMILLEDQFKIKDVVTINSMTGQVERITLRLTVLRDFEGKVYFIPNGQINSVINLTHEWSRVVLDISVAYKERIEKVMSVLLELGQAMCSDEAFKGSILREPELFGVERLEDSAVIVRLCLVVRPSQKDTIRREMLRRVKARFDELGIELPFPQRTVHFRPLQVNDGVSLRLQSDSNTLPPAQPAMEDA